MPVVFPSSYTLWPSAADARCETSPAPSPLLRHLHQKGRFLHCWVEYASQKTDFVLPRCLHLGRCSNNHSKNIIRASQLRSPQRFWHAHQRETFQRRDVKGEKSRSAPGPSHPDSEPLRKQGRQAGFRGRGRGAESENPGRGSGSSGFADPKPRPGSGVVGVRLIQNPDPGGVGDFPGFIFFLNFFMIFFSSRARALSTVLSTSSSRPPACAGYSRSFNEHQSSPHPRLRRRRPLRAQRAAAAAEEEEEEGEEARWRRLSPPWLSCA